MSKEREREREERRNWNSKIFDEIFSLIENMTLIRLR